MSFTKFASLENAEVLGIKGSSSPIRTANLDKFADFDEYRTEDGFLYARIRAISSRVNKNFDGWPSVELAGDQEIFNRYANQLKTSSIIVKADSNAKYGYSTFLGKPIFVDHHNSDPDKARGVIVDSKLHVEDHKTASELDPYYENAPDNHTPPTWVELLLEIDAKSFPRLAAAIIEGSQDPSKGIDGFSMGCDVLYSRCSHCGNKATSPDQYCEHVRLKGAEFPYTDKHGKTSSRKSYEDCYGIKFFEISCFPGDTPILVPSGVTKPIASLRVGDEVIDHLGNAQIVTEVMSREVDEDLIQISRGGYGGKLPLEATPEHPILVINDDQLKTRDQEPNRRKRHLIQEIEQGLEPSFIPAREIQKGDWLVEIVPNHVQNNFALSLRDYTQYGLVKETVSAAVQTVDGTKVCPSCDTEIHSSRKFCNRRCYGDWLQQNNATNARGKAKEIPYEYDLDEALGRWIGWYLAEGSIEYNKDRSTRRNSHNRLPKSVIFTLGSHEQEFIQEILDLGKSLFGIDGWVSEVRESSREIHFGNRYLAELMTNFGTDCYTKQIPQSLMEGPLSFLNAIALAHEDGDGHFNPSKTSKNRHSHRTSSRALADQIYHIHMWMNRLPYRSTQLNDAPHYIAGHLTQSSVPSHTILWYQDRVQSPTNRVIVGNNIFSRVTKVNHKPYKGRVYNLEVEDTHTYVAQGSAVHNCVFDPADETALLREVRAHTAAEDLNANKGFLIWPNGGQWQVRDSDNDHAVVSTHDSKEEAQIEARKLNSQRESTTHVAEAPPPQVDELKVPEKVDTLREESICPVCGSDLSEDTCSVCGYQRPPDGFDNPDLSAAGGPEVPAGQGAEAPEQDEQFGGPVVPEGNGTSNSQSIAHVNNDMSWSVTTTAKTSYTNPATETPVVPNAGPATDEPKDAVVKQDHAKPVTSKVRTAEDFLVAAGARRRKMSTKTADAASGAPEVATPDKNVDADAVGGVMESTNEDASKADAQIDVEGQGTTGVSDVAADKTESVDQGDEHSKNIEEIPTKTWGNGSGVEEQHDPVGGDAYPAEGGVTSSWEVTALDSEPYPHEDGGLAGGGANEGTQPADPVGNPDERVDVLDSVTTPENNSGETKTWSGTDGNAVTRQQEPVTTETLEGNDIVNLSPSTSSVHIFAAMKLADEEVKLGLTPEAEKFERAAELEKLSPNELQAEARVVNRVRTAGLSKAGQKTAKRMPSLGRNASVESEPKKESKDESIEDSSLFLN